MHQFNLFVFAFLTVCRIAVQGALHSLALTYTALLPPDAPTLTPPQGVEMEEVLRVLRKRFTQSGIEEKAARPPKQR